MFELAFLRSWLLMVAPVVLGMCVLLWYTNLRIRLRTRLRYGNRKFVDGLSESLTWRTELVSLLLWLGVFFFLLLAAAGPSVPAPSATVPVASLQVVVVLDVSDSMLAEQEYRPLLTDANSPPLGFGPYGNRIDMVNQIVLTQIMPALPGNELGIVTYAGQGWVQVDLSTDFESTKWVLRHWVKAGSAPGAGSDYAEGLKTAVAVFDDAKPRSEKDRVILLFSDGGYTGTSAGVTDTMELLRIHRVRLIVVGVGETRPVPLPIYNEFGQLMGYRKDGAGRNANVALDETNLVALARMSNSGRYFHLRNAPDTMPIDWASTLSGNGKNGGGTDIYAIPLAVSLLGLLILFSARRQRSK